MSSSRRLVKQTRIYPQDGVIRPRNQEKRLLYRYRKALQDILKSGKTAQICSTNRFYTDGELTVVFFFKYIGSVEKSQKKNIFHDMVK